MLATFGRTIQQLTSLCLFVVIRAQVPPNTSVTIDIPPVVGPKEVTLATCVAANAKPAAKITWDDGALGSQVRAVTNSTQHEDGTVTVVSHLLGVPTRELNQQLVQCVVNQSALETEKTLPYNINIHYPPSSANISVISPLVFNCVAAGNPKPVYTWKRVNQPRWYGPARQGDRLTFDPKSDLDGLYVCEASNLHGTATATVYVYLNSEMTSCQRASRKSKQEYRESIMDGMAVCGYTFISCEDNGDYSPLQCMTGMFTSCWCVSRDGTELPGKFLGIPFPAPSSPWHCTIGYPLYWIAVFGLPLLICLIVGVVLYRRKRGTLPGSTQKTNCLLETEVPQTTQRIKAYLSRLYVDI